MIRKILCCLFLPLIICSCDSIKIPHSKYKGIWASTQFEYIFKPNGDFLFRTIGHYGNTETGGRYARIDSILLLYPYTEWTELHGVLKTKLIYHEKLDCLRDFDNNYYCSNTDDLNDHIIKEEKIVDSIKQRLKGLPGVDEIINDYAENPNDDHWEPNMEYDGIFLVNKVEYDIFELRAHNKITEGVTRPYQFFQKHKYLVNRKANIIYRHHHRGDSLSYVIELFDN